MARRIELLDEELHVHYSGLSLAAAAKRDLHVSYEAIRSVRIGLESLPGTFAVKLGASTAPFGATRRGTFWTGGRRVFLDLNDPERAVLLELEGQDYARVALNVDDPEGFAERLRAKLSPGRRP
jgi:hypothetical protein